MVSMVVAVRFAVIQLVLSSSRGPLHFCDVSLSVQNSRFDAMMETLVGSVVVRAHAAHRMLRAHTSLHFWQPCLFRFMWSLAEKRALHAGHVVG